MYWTNCDKLFENIQVRWKHRISKGRGESVMKKNQLEEWPEMWPGSISCHDHWVLLNYFSDVCRASGHYFCCCLFACLFFKTKTYLFWTSFQITAIPLHRKWACDLQRGWPTCRPARIAVCLCCAFLCSLWYLSRCMIKSSVWHYNSNQLFTLCESRIHCLVSPRSTGVWLHE